MPTDKDALRRKVFATLRKVADAFGLEAAESGRSARMREFDEGTGYWADPADATSKPPRWLLHLIVNDGKCEAHVPDADGSKRPGYFNTANRKVGVGCFRINVAVKFGDDAEFKLYDAWDWLVWLAFRPALKHGSSGQMLEDFDPTTGALTYMGDPQPYIAAGLVGLCDPADSLSQSGESITYADATAALGAILHVHLSLPLTAVERGKNYA